MELFDLDELPAALLTVHPLLQPLVALQMDNMEKRRGLHTGVSG